MSLRPLLCLLLLAGWGQRVDARLAVVSYLPEWRYEGAHWDTLLAHSSHLLFFSLEPLPSGAIGATDRLPSAPILAVRIMMHAGSLACSFAGDFARCGAQHTSALSAQ